MTDAPLLPKTRLWHNVELYLTTFQGQGYLMDHTYTEAQLHKIIDEALIYMCACPAQVAKQILELRKLHNYQMTCENANPGQNDVHVLIAKSTAISHVEMEKCLTRILEIEAWDLQTLEMPAGLRKYRDEQLQNS
jgi:hypothetical protein